MRTKRVNNRVHRDSVVTYSDCKNFNIWPRTIAWVLILRRFDFYVFSINIFSGCIFAIFSRMALSPVQNILRQVVQECLPGYLLKLSLSCWIFLPGTSPQMTPSLTVVFLLKKPRLVRVLPASLRFLAGGGVSVGVRVSASFFMQRLLLFPPHMPVSVHTI